MKMRILLAALALGAAACSADVPTAADREPAELRVRNNGYIGSGNRSDADSTRVQDNGFIGTGNLADPVDDQGGSSLAGGN